MQRIFNMQKGKKWKMTRKVEEEDEKKEKQE
jgi:hypothetical protein